MRVLDAFRVLQNHRARLVSDDPYSPRTFTKWCVVCSEKWPCAPRTEAAETARLADRLLAEHERQAV